MGSLSVPGLAAIFVFLAFIVAGYAILVPAKERLLGSSTTDDFEFKSPDAVPTGFLGRNLQGLLNNFQPKLPFTRISEARYRRLGNLIVKAGNPLNVNPEEFFGAQLVLATFGAVFGFGLTFVPQLQIVPAPLWVLLGIVLGYIYLPGRYQTAKQARSNELQRQMPEALDLLTVTMKSGQTFEQSMQRVVEQLPVGLLRLEFTRAVLERGTGATLADSLTGIYQRVESQEAEAFAKAIIQAETLGADIADTLNRQADTARRNYQNVIERRIAALPLNLVLPMGLTMVPAFLIVILAPTAYNLTQNLL